MNRIRRALRRAFTLVEMLTVIAIIGILAGILIPTVMMVMKKARIHAAHADIKTLEQAISAYTLDFGGAPPDRPFDSAGNLIAPFPLDPGNVGLNLGLNPNQCMVWFLTRTYSTGSMAQGVLGQPAGYPGNPNGDWNPATSLNVFARGSYGPYFTPKARQTKDIGRDGYPEFVDPWGRPYVYRAYYPPAPQQLPTSGQPAQWATATVAAVNGTTATLALANSAIGLPNVSGMTNSVGSIQLNFPTAPACNGTYAYTGVADSAVKVTFATPPPVNAVGACGFPLHNPQSCDIYSLGPNGTTRATQRPLNGEWHPVDAPSLGPWVQFWGTSGDGNDTEGGNILINAKDQGNINNW